MNELNKLKVLNNQLLFVAISKYNTSQDIEKAIKHGFMNFGESRIEEMQKKILDVNNDNIKWHFIGRIQTKKIKKIVQHSTLIHSVSSLKHLNKINEEAFKINKLQNILLQINLTDEESKGGFEKEEINNIVKVCTSLERINLKGIMVIGPHTEDKSEINLIFKEANTLFKQLQQNLNIYDFNILSMGMSNDYELALKNNSNCLRIGSKLFDNLT